MNSFYYEKIIKRNWFHINRGLISRKDSIYSPQNISIGNNVGIDNFCILSGKIEIGNHVHIAAGVMLFGGDYGIILEDFVGISSRCAVYAASDDYSGQALTNPTVPDEFRNVIGGTVVFKKHSLVGSGCTVLPYVKIGERTSIGNTSLVNKSLDEWGIYTGIPCHRVKDGIKRLLSLEQDMLCKKRKRFLSHRKERA